MLDISPGKIAQVIFLSRELYDRGGLGDGGAHRGNAVPAEAELRAYIENLNEDELVSLVAVMWIGRDSFDASEIREAMQTARDEATTPTADYLIGTPHLSDHLENGLEALGYSVEEVEDGIF